jgi:two-component system NtrC family sensor kinase
MLASGIAHELNNPLTAILGFSSALLDRTRDEGGVPRDELEEYLAVINGETLRCRDIVEALSTLTIDREPVIGDVSLQECVDGAVRLVLPRAQGRNVDIVNAIDEDCVVRADGSRLSQAFFNVLSNAVDFAEGKGTVTIEIDDAQERSGFATVRVVDDGPGIDPSVLPRVFDLFFTTKEVGKGTGLGLTMCHGILRDAGGSIDIVSEPGKGTTVILEIPRAGATTQGGRE